MNNFEKPPPYCPTAPSVGHPNAPPPPILPVHANPEEPVYLGPPQGYRMPVVLAPMRNYGSIYAPLPTQTNVIIIGGCPTCRAGVLEEDYPCIGICLAVFCFPLGILCCLAMKQRRCPNCGATFA